MKSMFVKFLEEIEEPKFFRTGSKGYSLAIFITCHFQPSERVTRRRYDLRCILR
jgi:hypothetical protein